MLVKFKQVLLLSLSILAVSHSGNAQTAVDRAYRAIYSAFEERQQLYIGLEDWIAIDAAATESLKMGRCTKYFCYPYYRYRSSKLKKGLLKLAPTYLMVIKIFDGKVVKPLSFKYIADATSEEETRIKTEHLRELEKLYKENSREAFRVLADHNANRQGLRGGKAMVVDLDPGFKSSVPLPSAIGPRDMDVTGYLNKMNEIQEFTETEVREVGELLKAYRNDLAAEKRQNVRKAHPQRDISVSAHCAGALTDHQPIPAPPVVSGLGLGGQASSSSETGEGTGLRPRKPEMSQELAEEEGKQPKQSKRYQMATSGSAGSEGTVPATILENKAPVKTAQPVRIPFEMLKGTSHLKTFREFMDRQTADSVTEEALVKAWKHMESAGCSVDFNGPFREFWFRDPNAKVRYGRGDRIFMFHKMHKLRDPIGWERAYLSHKRLTAQGITEDSFEDRVGEEE